LFDIRIFAFGIYLVFCYSLLVWLLLFDYWLLSFGDWLLVIIWYLVLGYWLFSLSLVIGRSGVIIKITCMTS
jgi:hypothetical protein